MPRWSVQQFVHSPKSLIRNRLEYRGTVVADTEEQAIATALQRLRLKPAQKKKIVVTKLSD